MANPNEVKLILRLDSKLDADLRRAIGKAKGASNFGKLTEGLKKDFKALERDSERLSESLSDLVSAKTKQDLKNLPRDARTSFKQLGVILKRDVSGEFKKITKNTNDARSALRKFSALNNAVRSKALKRSILKDAIGELSDKSILPSGVRARVEVGLESGFKNLNSGQLNSLLKDLKTSLFAVRIESKKSKDELDQFARSNRGLVKITTRVRQSFQDISAGLKTLKIRFESLKPNKRVFSAFSVALRVTTTGLKGLGRFLKVTGVLLNFTARAVGVLTSAFFNSTPVRLFGEALKVFGRAAKIVGRVALDVGRRIVVLGFKFLKAIRPVDKLKRAFRGLKFAASSVKSVLSSLSLGGFIFGAALLAGVTALGVGIVKTTAKFETFKLQLQAITKDSVKAALQFKRIRDFAATSPLTTEEVVQSFVRLRATGIAEAEKVTRTLANVAVVFNRDLRDIAAAFIGVETRVLRRLGVLLVRVGRKAVIQVRDTVRLVDNDIKTIRKTIKELFDKEFNDAVDIVKKSLNSQFKILTSLLQEVAADIGEVIRPALAGFIFGLNEFVSDARPIIRALVDLLVNDFMRFKLLFKEIERDFQQAFFGRDDSVTVRFKKVVEDIVAIFNELAELLIVTISQISSTIWTPLVIGARVAFAQILNEFVLTMKKASIVPDPLTSKLVPDAIIEDRKKVLGFLQGEALQVRDILAFKLDDSFIAGEQLFGDRKVLEGLLEFNKVAESTKLTLTQLAIKIGQVRKEGGRFGLGELVKGAPSTGAPEGLSAGDIASVKRAARVGIINKVSVLRGLVARTDFEIERDLEESVGESIDIFTEATLKNLKTGIGNFGKALSKFGEVAKESKKIFSEVLGPVLDRANSKLVGIAENRILANAEGAIKLMNAARAKGQKVFQEDVNVISIKESLDIVNRELRVFSSDLDKVKLIALKGKLERALIITKGDVESILQRNKRIFDGAREEFFGLSAGSKGLTKIFAEQKGLRDILEDNLVRSGENLLKDVQGEEALANTIERVGSENNLFLLKVTDALVDLRVKTVNFGNKALNKFDALNDRVLSKAVNQSIKQGVTSNQQLKRLFDALKLEGSGAAVTKGALEGNVDLLRKVNKVFIQQQLKNLKLPPLLKKVNRDFKGAFVGQFESFLKQSPTGDSESPANLFVRLKDIQAELQEFIKSGKAIGAVAPLVRNIFEDLPLILQDKAVIFGEKQGLAVVLESVDAFRKDFIRTLTPSEQELSATSKIIGDLIGPKRIARVLRKSLRALMDAKPEFQAEAQGLLASLQEGKFSPEAFGAKVRDVDRGLVTSLNKQLLESKFRSLRLPKTLERLDRESSGGIRKQLREIFTRGVSKRGGDPAGLTIKLQKFGKEIEAIFNSAEFSAKNFGAILATIEVPQRFQAQFKEFAKTFTAAQLIRNPAGIVQEFADSLSSLGQTQFTILSSTAKFAGIDLEKTIDQLLAKIKRSVPDAAAKIQAEIDSLGKDFTRETVIERLEGLLPPDKVKAPKIAKKLIETVEIKALIDDKFKTLRLASTLDELDRDSNGAIRDQLKEIFLRAESKRGVAFDTKDLTLKARRFGKELEAIINSAEFRAKNFSAVLAGIEVPPQFRERFNEFAEKLSTTELLKNPKGVVDKFVATLSQVGEERFRFLTAGLDTIESQVDKSVKAIISRILRLDPTKAPQIAAIFANLAEGFDVASTKAQLQALVPKTVKEKKAEDPLNRGIVSPTVNAPTAIGVGIGEGLEGLRNKFLDFGTTAKEAVDGIANSLSTNLTTSILALIEGTRSAKDAFKDFTQAVIADMIKLLVRALALKLVLAAIGFIPGGGAATGPIASAAGAGGGGGLLDIFGDGGVSSRSINKGSMVPMRAFAGGGIVNQPTVALFGERKPEAFVPLPDGKNIPVKMQNDPLRRQGERQNITVNINAIDSKSLKQTLEKDRRLVLDIVNETLRKSPTGKSSFFEALGG